MKKICSVLPVIIALVLSVGVMTVFRACPRGEDGMWMHCHDAQSYIFLAGLLMLAASAIAGISASSAEKRSFSSRIETSILKPHTVRYVGILFAVVGIAAALVCFFIPGTIVHMCMMETMRCHALMKPFAKVMSILYIIPEMIVLLQLIRK